eukprot:scaffold2438_cov388-Prasinococcus_capsulatus_cf.AAC.4
MHTGADVSGTKMRLKRAYQQWLTSEAKLGYAYLDLQQQVGERIPWRTGQVLHCIAKATVR